MAGKYAAQREDGLFAYVVTTNQWGKSYDRIEWAESLTEAKRAHGWTRMSYTSIRVRRATPADVEREVSS